MQHSCEDSAAGLEKSVWRIGVRQELRAPPMIVQSSVTGIDDEFRALQWGTLADATRRCWLRDVEGKNEILQASLRRRVKRALLYRRGIFPDCARFLVYWGNSQNANATPTTITQVFTYTAEVARRFSSEKNFREVTNNSVGRSKVMEMRLSCAHAMYPQFWKDATSLERSTNVFKEMRKLTISRGEYAGQTLWTALASRKE